MVAHFAKIKVEIVTNNQNIRERDFVIVGKSADGFTGIVVIFLWFNKKRVVAFSPDSTKFGVLRPLELVGFKIKIQQ